MGKTPKLAVRDVADIPLREVSGLAVRRTPGAQELLAVGDHDPVLFSAPLQGWPLHWEGTDLSGLGLPDGGTQFEALVTVDERIVLILQEQPARVVRVDVSVPALVGATMLDVPTGHRLRESWLGDRSSRGESMVLTGQGHLIVVKEKDPPAILEFGPVGDAPVGWQRDRRVVAPEVADTEMTVLATWWLSGALAEQLPDVSDSTVGPDGCLYLLSDQGSAIARLPDTLDPAGGSVDAEALWRIGGRPEKAEGLAILADGTPLVALDTKAPRGNLLRLEPVPLESSGT